MSLKQVVPDWEPDKLSFYPFAGGWMELYRTEKVAELASKESGRECRSCGRKLRPNRAFVNADTGEVIQTFECDCGERDWNG